MSISRRRFLERTALAVAGAGVSQFLRPLGGNLLARTTLAGNLLRTPGIFSGGDLIAARQSVNLWSDTPTPLWTLGGGSPGPTIRVRKGETFSAQLVNQLEEPTNIHWHGLLVPADMDGHPRDIVEPGSSRQYTFTVNQRAGLYWYHPHPHMMAGKQMYLGMAGLFIVDDDEEDALNLPSEGYELPLIIQDRRFGPGRTLDYAPTMADEMVGMLGDTMMVNGTPEPYTQVSQDIYRLRVLNACNARILRLGFDDGASFNLIGGDVGLHATPTQVSSVRLGPGERADLLVDFSNRSVGSSATLRTLPYGAATSAAMQGWGMDILRFDVTSAAQRTYAVPTTLSVVEQLDPARAGRNRPGMLSMQHDHASGMMVHMINGQAFSMDRIDAESEPGGIETWNFRNMSDEPHPMHFHGAHFQVVSRDSGTTPLAPEDIGWKDTVIVDPDELVRVVVRFGEEPGLFMVHCHNLEHEDSGMMSNIMVGSASDVASRDHEAAAMRIEQLSPSPARDHTTLTLYLATPDTPEFRLYNSTGSLVRSWTADEHRVGTAQFPLDLTGLPSGTYLIEAACHHTVASTRLIIAR